MRSQTVTELQTLSQAETLGSEILELEYRSQALTSVEEEPESLKHYFIQQFVKQRRRECELGITLSGPHRDDFLIALQNKDARQFASEGQQRSCVASLKLAQWKWLKRLADQPPLLCIDDIGVSFDHKREEAFYRRIQDLGQVFVTSARPLPFDGHSISVQNGNLIF
jgi:DNA replication and repair protein RecF